MRKRIDQILQAWRLTRENDPRMPVFVLGSGAAMVLLGVAAWLLIGGWYWIVTGLMLAFAVMMIVFGRRVQAGQFAAIEGQPGAAAAVLNVMRGQWFVSPVVAFTKKQDLVHRVVGRPGIILVGEGQPVRVKQLLQQEKKRLGRVAGEVSIHSVIVGNGDKEVPLDKLQVHLARLPRELSKTEVPKLERRLKPLDRDLPIPKGYVPNPGKKMR